MHLLQEMCMDSVLLESNLSKNNTICFKDLLRSFNSKVINCVKCISNFDPENAPYVFSIVLYFYKDVNWMVKINFDKNHLQNNHTFRDSK